MNPRGNRGPGRGRLFRLLLLFVLLSTGGRFLGGGGGRLLETPDALVLPVVGTVGLPIVFGVAVGVVAVVGALALRAGVFDGRSDEDAPPGDYTCRYCGTNLERYRNRCPHCETRDPVAYQDDL
ncbi:hypothetical protein DMJ13_09640 [halophilic archaeon]|nr:hypothetical protein DMJ13_09640 [halophilic archaeon]